MNAKVWTRPELRERGRNAFKRNYWWCVLAALILMLITGGASSNGRSDKKNIKVNYNQNYSYNIDWSGNNSSSYDWTGNSGSLGSLGSIQNTFSKENLANTLGSKVGGTAYSLFKGAFGLAGGVIGLFLLTVIAVIFVVAIALRVFLFNPLEMGGRKFFLENALEKKDGIGSFLDAFKSGYYGNVVVTMLVKDVKVFLWTLLLIIPGIVKAYEYRMVPYILAEHPELGYSETLRMSSEMMDGQKWNAFVLDLSFIGWEILSAFTCGILSIFWVNPYEYATQAELYLELSMDDHSYNVNPVSDMA
ncbi:MAG: DUF975 family protein [Lachnospiraceae bacterium]|nr:DUF975 family protein [Lachnospiraceae bacterium]